MSDIISKCRKKKLKEIFLIMDSAKNDSIKEQMSHLAGGLLPTAKEEISHICGSVLNKDTGNDTDITPYAKKIVKDALKDEELNKKIELKEIVLAVGLLKVNNKLQEFL